MPNKGKLSVDDLPQLVKLKGEHIAEGGLLEFYPPGDNAFELGGFARLKAWLEREQVGFGKEAHALGLGPPRGVMIVASRAAEIPGRETDRASLAAAAAQAGCGSPV